MNEVKSPVDKTVDNTPKKMSYKEMYQALNPYKPPTAEELEAQRKKEKRQKTSELQRWHPFSPAQP